MAPLHTVIPERASAMRRAAAALAQARAQQQPAPTHRAVRAVRLRPASFVLACAAAIAILVLCVLMSAEMRTFWREVILAWAAALGLPLRAGLTPFGVVWVGEPLAPHLGVLVASVVAVSVLVFAASLRLPDRCTPIVYVLGAGCVIEFASVLLFLAAPSAFSHTVESHVDAILEAGQIVMWCAAAGVAGALALLRAPLSHSIVRLLVVMAYFVLMLPHKAIFHVLVLSHLSLVFMPVLFFCFGLMFDVLVLVALFSWVLSASVEPYALRWSRRAH